MAVPGPDQGYHDIQRGAAGYSVVVGAFGALAVPAIVLVFTAPPTHVANAQTLEVFATGLLVTGMFGSLLGAIAFAYLAAERDPIAALAPAIVFAAVPVSVSFSSILGAFEVLAVLYQPSAKGLFAITVAAGGLFGVIYSSLAVIHSVTLGPTDEAIRQEWLPRQTDSDTAGRQESSLGDSTGRRASHRRISRYPHGRDPRSPNDSNGERCHRNRDSPHNRGAAPRSLTNCHIGDRGAAEGAPSGRDLLDEPRDERFRALDAGCTAVTPRR
jgi:hypothetical protein